MSKNDKIGFTVLGIVAGVGLIWRLWGLDAAFSAAVVITAITFWQIFKKIAL